MFYKFIAAGIGCATLTSIYKGYNSKWSANNYNSPKMSSITV